MRTRNIAIFLALTFAVLAVILVYRIRRSQILLWQIERHLNAIYRTYHPFPYRWPGAISPDRHTEGHSTSNDQLGKELALIDQAEHFEKSSRTMELRGRIALLSHDYDLAVKQMGEALFMGGNEQELHLQLGIALALQAQHESQPLGYEKALEQMLQAQRLRANPETLFDLALLYGQIPLHSQAVKKWNEAINADTSAGWQKEAKIQLLAEEEILQTRARHVHELTDSPASYLSHVTTSSEAVELVLDTAFREWIPAGADQPITRQALRQLAMTLENKYRDPWLSDLLARSTSPQAKNAIRLLSESWRANSEGKGAEATQAASFAESHFRKLGNPAGALRSRLERIYSLHLRLQADDCLNALDGFRADVRWRHYVWMEGQAQLEEITCMTLPRRAEVIKRRERAYLWIRNTGYTALTLRALGFLMEPYVSFGSRSKIWERGCEGLKAFWSNSFPSVRAEQLYLSMALSAKGAGDLDAAIALLQEAIDMLTEYQNRYLKAVEMADLGAWQAEAGFQKDAALTFDQTAVEFQQLNPQETEDRRLEAEVARAEGEIASGNSRAAIARLQRVTDKTVFPYSALTPTVRRRLLPAMGDAFLWNGNFAEALRYYDEITAESLQESSTIHNPIQRDNAQKQFDSAWRGRTEANLRSGDKSRSLLVWETFRAARLEKQPLSHIRLPVGSVLLVYAVLPGGLSAWMVDDRGIEQHWVDAGSIIHDAEKLSGLAADRDSPIGAIQATARRLYKSLIQPFEVRLPDRGTLIIDPDGPLATVPWSALEDSHGRVLLERFAITQITGWIEPQVMKSKLIDLTSPLIFSTPKLGTQLEKQYPPLIEAEIEAENLRQRLRHVQFFAGDRATLGSFLVHIRHATLFYFAGHGISNGEQGALLFAQLRGGDTDAQLITSTEVADLELHSLQLVVLASCSSGAGEQTGIVNLDSLVRGFLEAGAHRVVAARWDVNSAETAKLMDYFYEGLVDQQAPAEALRKASLALYQQPKTAHPYYWASFQTFGNP